jgi:hypothetical protein
MKNKKLFPAGFDGPFYLLCTIKVQFVVSDREHSVFPLDGPEAHYDYSFLESYETHEYTAVTNL